MLSVPEFAKALGIRESTVRAWILRRAVSYHKIGRRVLFTEDEVSRILSAGAVPAAPQRPTA
jgi:excisionase family DNA binding protein